MKYNLIVLHPDSNALLAASKILSSVNPLFIMSLILWEPASGAKVNPVFLTFCISLIKSTEKASTLIDGSAIPTLSASCSKTKLDIKFWIFE